MRPRSVGVRVEEPGARYRVRGVERIKSIKPQRPLRIEIPGTQSPVPPPDAAAGFLHQVGKTEASAFPGVGMGQAIRLQGPTLAGAGLAVDDALVHLAAFRIEGDGPSRGGWRQGRMTRASQRFA
jgi:hypothetical protein